VVKIDLRDRRNFRQQHVCSVKAAAHSRLEYGELGSRNREVRKGNGRDTLKKRRVRC
jgi:hypothetical protein